MSMRLEIRDRLSLAGGKINEDRVGFRAFARQDCAWVIDGATGVGERDYVPEGPTDAAWLAEQLSAELAARDPAGDTVPAYFRGIVAAVAARYRALVPEAETVPLYARPSATAAWAALRHDELTLAWQGDCGAILDRGDGVTVLGGMPLNILEADIEEIVRETLANMPSSEVPMLKRLGPVLQQRRALLNQPGGYWMLGIEPQAADHLGTRLFPVTRPARLLLLSDGLYRLVDHFEAYDAAGLLDAAFARGLDTLGAELRALEQADPEGRRVPRVKPYDDASGLLLAIAPD